ncbi:SAYSvFN domain-containing protein 1 [Orussus abietinus]|uniref:SAYSvFN domain-containing protein 1 n=1 Tax=Orussus abietinus TaxID=222816 RepID=UPI0006260852|nr:SAYSvFN domain-containing protein 1 [Orussus abietinus]
MAEQLAEYRRKKRRRAVIESVKNTLTMISSRNCDSVSISPMQDTEDAESIRVDDGLDSMPSESRTIAWIFYLLYTLLWTTLYAIALKFEFGAVYFVSSSLVLMWRNMRSGPKKKGEVSAYSVFNPNCEAIDGTLKAEQFEREIRYGAMTVR